MSRVAIARTVFAERGVIRGLAWLGLRTAKLLGFRFSRTPSTTAGGQRVQVVYVATDKDLSTISHSIRSLENVSGVEVSEIVVIGARGTGIEQYAHDRGLRFVDEVDLLGFASDRYPYPEGSGARSGWLYQQLLKLGWAEVAGEGAYVVVDADTVFVNPVRFQERSRYSLFLSEEWQQPYSDAVELLLGFRDTSLWSYVAHMMIFDVEMVKEMLGAIESLHGMPWHGAIAKTRALDTSSCFSEYHLYGAWAKRRHPTQVVRTPLYNSPAPRDALGDKAILNAYRSSCSTVSFHSYIGG